MDRLFKIILIFSIATFVFINPCFAQRFHATPDGNIPFTEAEELARDIKEAQWASQAQIRLQQEEIKQLELDFKKFMIYHFSMTQALFEALKAKGILSASDIDDPYLKQIYSKWGPKITRYREVNEP